MLKGFTFLYTCLIFLVIKHIEVLKFLPPVLSQTAGSLRLKHPTRNKSSTLEPHDSFKSCGHFTVVFSSNLLNLCELPMLEDTFV